MSRAHTIKQLALWPAFASLGYAFWVLGGMELLERLAYFAVKTVRVLYATGPISSGGLGLPLTKVGLVLSAWALVQTTVPIALGGIADRLGLRQILLAATACKVASYVLMAFLPSYAGFLASAVLLAFGTGIFKPTVQGWVVKVTDRRVSSVAWGVFYQTVNIGSFLGPVVAASLRQIGWRYLFLCCAGIIALNSIALLTFKDNKRPATAGVGTRLQGMWRDAIGEIRRSEVLLYLLAFSGFWFMFLSLFDLLPLFVQEWVDTRQLVRAIFGGQAASSPLVIFLLGMSNSGDSIRPEGVLNVDSLMIMSTCLLVAGVGARFRPVHSMVIGTTLCALALLALGATHTAWPCVAAVMAFSVGEMLSGPKFLEFLGNLAPPERSAMYLGFSQLPQGIGAVLEGYLGPLWYGQWSSKELFSRQYLLDHGYSAAMVDRIPSGDAFTALLRVTHVSSESLTQILYQEHSVGRIWYIFGGIGVLSALGLHLYGRWLPRRDRRAGRGSDE